MVEIRKAAIAEIVALECVCIMLSAEKIFRPDGVDPVRGIPIALYPKIVAASFVV